jgi:uncharacterized protein DUF4231
MTTTRRDTRRTPANEVEALRDRLASLDLDPEQIAVAEERCVHYVGWLEKAATRSHRSHHALSMTALLAGLLIPALTGLGDEGAFRWSVFALGLVVAIAIGVDSRLNLEGRWLHYRRTAELMKSEAWLFAGLSGPYEGKDHRTAFPAFQAAFETLARQEVATYVAGPARPASQPTQTTS